MSATLFTALLLQAAAPESQAASAAIAQYAGRSECVADLAMTLPRGSAAFPASMWGPPTGIALSKGERAAIAGDYATLQHSRSPRLAVAPDFTPLPAGMKQVPKDMLSQCGSSLSLYRPERSGATIFVGTNYVCGRLLCAGGMIWALRQRGGQWRIVASKMEWVS